MKKVDKLFLNKYLTLPPMTLKMWQMKLKVSYLTTRDRVRKGILYEVNKDA